MLGHTLSEIEPIENAFCSHCFSAHELINTVIAHGHRIEECNICHSRDVPTLAAAHPLLKRIYRALIRVHYSEWAYNTHLGGTHLSELLFGRNNVMNLDTEASREHFECALQEIERGWYPVTDEEISLGGGYWDGGILVGLRARLDSKLTTLLNRGFKENYFRIQDEVAALLATLTADIATTMQANSRLYRARIGVGKRLTHVLADFDPDYYYLPYSGCDIGAPPVHLSSEGRLNRSRVSILYLASDRETAVAEVRPHPGHLVSTAEFVANAPSKIADFTSKDVRNFLSDPRLDDLRRIFSFNSLLNLPVPPDKREYYLITQLLSDCVREAGFDGVKFQSSLGSGDNIAIFLPERFSLVPGSEKAHGVRALSYVIDDESTLTQDYDASDFEEDSDDPFSTLFDILERTK